MKNFKLSAGPSSANLSSGTASIILQIIMLIIKLILSGKKEDDAIEIAAVRHKIPVSKVKSIWKSHR